MQMMNPAMWKMIVLAVHVVCNTTDVETSTDTDSYTEIDAGADTDAEAQTQIQKISWHIITLMNRYPDNTGFAVNASAVLLIGYIFDA